MSIVIKLSRACVIQEISDLIEYVMKDSCDELLCDKTTVIQSRNVNVR